MPQRSGLGKGLDALIPAGQTRPAEGGVAQVPVDLIGSNPHQPREHFDATELEELAASIREHGIIQPIVVAPGADGRYTLIAGERRLQAARKAGLKTVPVVIRHASDQQLLELVLAVSLGPRVLRSETAGPAAIAVLQAIMGDFRAPQLP